MKEETLNKVAKKLKESGEKGLSAKELAKGMGYTGSNESNAAYDYIYEARNYFGKDSIVKKKEGNEFRYYWSGSDNKQLFKKSRDLAEELSKEDSPVRTGGTDFTYKSEHDIFILVIAADWHIGEKHINYDALEDVCTKIGKYEEVKVIGLGDLISNNFSGASPKYSESSNFLDKNAQLDLLKYFFKKCGEDSLLRIYEGSHELRSKRADDFLVSKYLALEHNSEYGWYQEPFIIEMCDEEYKIYARHEPGSKSQYQPTRGLVKACLFDQAKLARDADILIGAHYHKPAKEKREVGGKMRLMLQTGCSVNFSHYAEDMGFVSESEGAIPCIVFRKDAEPLAFLNFSEALDLFKEKLTEEELK